MRLSTEAVKGLKEVKKAILAEPRQFIMGEFFAQSDEFVFAEGNNGPNREPARHIPNCNTAACFAGHTIAIYHAKTPREARTTYGFNPFDQAAFILGLDYDTAACLFYLGRWPYEFHINYLYADTPEKRA